MAGGPLLISPKPSSGKRHDRTNFHATKTSAGNLRRDGSRSSLVRRFNEVVPAELFFGFRKRAIRRERLAVSHAHGLRFGRGQQSITTLDGVSLLLAERIIFLHLSRIEPRSKTLFILVNQ